MDRRIYALSITLALFPVVGCGRETPVATGLSSKSERTSKTFPLKGVVRQVDAKTGEVTISHEEIVGFMSKMTMPFNLEDKTLLEEIQPGDEVEGSLEVRYDGDAVKDMNLVDLTVVRRPSTAQGAASPPTEPPSETLKPGDLVPDFTVTTQEGRELKLGDLKGEVVVLTFIYTRCPLPEFCPAMDSKFADLARRISAVPGRAERIRLLSISFDPEHDTPEVLAAHAGLRGAKPPLWTFAVASHRELEKVASRFGLVYVPGTREFSHNLRTAVIGPDGRLATLEVGSGWTAAELLKVVYSLLRGDRK
jgi:protein SCO1